MTKTEIITAYADQLNLFIGQFPTMGADAFRESILSQFTKEVMALLIKRSGRKPADNRGALEDQIEDIRQGFYSTLSE